jgi:hypothetical protein
VGHTKANRFVSATLFVGSMLALTCGSAQEPLADNCFYDLEAMLALDEQSFDGDLSTGWRILARDNLCFEDAADLIRAYRERHTDSSTIVSFHEGQLRACVGQTRSAIALFERSRNPAGEVFGWNLLIEALVAYLRHDRAELAEARQALANLSGVDQLAAPVREAWREYLGATDQLIQCFDCEWEEAYAPCLQYPP